MRARPEINNTGHEFEPSGLSEGDERRRPVMEITFGKFDSYKLNLVVNSCSFLPSLISLRAY